MEAGPHQQIVQTPPVTVTPRGILFLLVALTLTMTGGGRIDGDLIALGTAGLLLLFAMPVGLSVLLLAMASWLTLAITAGTVGLGLVATAARARGGMGTPGGVHGWVSGVPDKRIQRKSRRSVCSVIA